LINCFLIGYGQWGKKINKSVNNLKKIQIIKIYKRYLSKRYKKNNLFTDNINFIENKKVNSVIISSSNESHFYYAKKSLLQKKNVFLEKPACYKEKEFTELLNIANKNKCVLHINYVHLYDQNIINLIFNYNLIKSINKNKKITKVYIELGKKLINNNFYNNYWDWTPHIFSIIALIDPSVKIRIKKILFKNNIINFEFEHKKIKYFCKYGYGFKSKKFKLQIKYDKYIFLKEKNKNVVKFKNKIIEDFTINNLPLNNSIEKYKYKIIDRKIMLNNEFLNITKFLDKNYKNIF